MIGSADEDAATRVADRSAPNVFLVVDRSPDMRVADQPGGADTDGARRATTSSR